MIMGVQVGKGCLGRGKYGQCEGGGMKVSGSGEGERRSKGGWRMNIYELVVKG